MEDRRLQIQKWKEEKERKKREAATHKKKPFVTGIVHPPLTYVPPPPLKAVASTSGRLTRSQSLKVKKEQQNTEKNSKTTKTTKPSNGNKILIPKNTTPKSESGSEERLRSPKSSSFEECLVQHNSLSHTPKTPKQLTDPKISPCVTLSRGKENARKEMKKKMEEGLLDEDTSNIESVQYFSAQLDSEVKSITEMCDSWEKISQQVPLTETAMNSAASLAMLRASYLGKNAESSDVTAFEISLTPKAPVNLAATPDKSILKATNASSKEKSTKKSIKVVIFNESDIASQDIKEDNFTQIVRSGDNSDDSISQSSKLFNSDHICEIENKENRTKAKLRRQDAVEHISPVLTRSRCKSMNTPLLDISGNVGDSRRVNEATEDETDKTPKRSQRKTKITVEISEL